MILWATFLLLLGVFLSGFFSGSETGFYRASRVRIVIANLDGDKISGFLLKLINNPTWFVATTLIGNNVANYVVSLAIVLGAKSLVTGDNMATELIPPLLMSPVLFVYGELLPKNLFFRAPNRLLRFWAPLFLFFSIVFAPVSLLLWGMAKMLEGVVGSNPETVQIGLARKEVQQVLLEGMEAGILHPTQRLLGQNFFLQAAKPVADLCTPIAKFEAVSRKMPLDSILKYASRKRLPDLPVYEKERTNLIGYYRAVDLWVAQDSDDLPEMLPFFRVQASELFGEVLMQMQAQRETIAMVVNESDLPIGLVTIDQLTDPLLKGPLGSLRR